jgi:FkbM family methyltransferase
MFRRLRTLAATRGQRLSLLTASAQQHTGLLAELGRTVEVETSFARLLLDADDEWITPTLAATQGWEPGETALLGERIKPAMTFLDIGAHVGYFTCLAARLVGPRGLVLAFEPSPRNYELLLANVWRNGFFNVVCFPWAVGAETGIVDLHQSSTNTGDHQVYASDPDRMSTPVRIAALDSIGALRPPVDIVKIDVQGAEEAVIRGMSALLEGSPSVLVTAEFWPAGLRRFGSDPAKLLDLCRSLGFGIDVQMPDEKGVLKLSEEEILAFCEQGDGEGHVNLVLERKPA